VIVFAVYNIKGGVGKTATAVNLAWLSARDGARTLLWDLDPQGASSFTFRIKPGVSGGGKGLLRDDDALAGSIKGTDYERLDVLPADFSYRNLDLVLDQSRKRVRGLARLLAPLEGEYDHVFIDCAPGISLVSENVFAAADVLLVPTIPTVLSLRTLGRLLKHLKQARHRPGRVLPFLCMVDRRKTLHRRVCEWAREHSKGFLEASIPYASLVEQMGVRRMPVAAFAPHSAAAQAYAELWVETRERLAAATLVVAPSRHTVQQLLHELQPPELATQPDASDLRPAAADRGSPASAVQAPVEEPAPDDEPAGDEQPAADDEPATRRARARPGQRTPQPEAASEPEADSDISGLELLPDEDDPTQLAPSRSAPDAPHDGPTNGHGAPARPHPLDPGPTVATPVLTAEPVALHPVAPEQERIEVEFKLRIAGAGDLLALAAQLPALEAALTGRAALQLNHFFDTSDWTLQALACTLRLREESGRFVLGAKGPAETSADGALSRRAEEEVDVDVALARQVLAGRLPPLEPLQARFGRDPASLTARIANTLGERPLRHVGSFKNERRRIGPLELPAADGPLSLVFEIDRTEFPFGRVDHEIEVEVAAADAERAGSALRALFQRAGLPWRSAASKAARLFGTLARETA